MTDRRHRKFTPERLQQIRNLRDRGWLREQIAEEIGCTVGSLQVTCSNHGISLRRPSMKPQINDSGGNQSPFLLTTLKNKRALELRIPIATLTTLALEATVRGMRITELIAKVLDAVVRRDMVRTLSSE